MKLVLTCTKDVVTGEMATQPQMFRNIAESERSFKQAMVALKNSDGIPATDYQLYKLGEIDTQTMEITPCVEFIASGAQFLGA